MEYKERYCASCGHWRGPEYLFYKVVVKGVFRYYRCEVCQDKKTAPVKGEIRPCA
jgi:hypothetical protein